MASTVHVTGRMARIPTAAAVVTAAAVPLAGWTVHSVIWHRRLAATRRDPLTGAQRRDGWTLQAHHLLARHRDQAVVLLADVDHFKAVNDQHGHAAGDAALQHIAQILVDSVRNTDVVGRLGGDEFGVLLVQTDEETAGRKADSLAETIRARPLLWQGKEITLSAAYGAHSFHGNENAAEALDAADRAMYERKKQRREGDK